MAKFKEYCLAYGNKVTLNLDEISSVKPFYHRSIFVRMKNGEEYEIMTDYDTFIKDLR